MKGKLNNWTAGVKKSINNWETNMEVKENFLKSRNLRIFLEFCAILFSFLIITVSVFLNDCSKYFCSLLIWNYLLTNEMLVLDFL